MSTVQNLPNDPVMLLSYVNLKLRDEFSSLSDFCKSGSIDEASLKEKLQTINYSYDESANQFK